MTLSEKARHELEMEFLQEDLGRLPAEVPVRTIKRRLTRFLVEHELTATPESALAAAVRCLDEVAAAWAASPARINEHVVDGVRQAATILAEAVERAGLTPPAQPTPKPPGPPDVVDVRLIDGTLVDQYEVQPGGLGLWAPP